MTKTYTIRREDLKKKNYNRKLVQTSGTEPKKRSQDLLVRVLKKAVQQ